MFGHLETDVAPREHLLGA